MARLDCAKKTYCSEHTLKFLCILVYVQQRYAALKLRLKRDHVPQSAMAILEVALVTQKQAESYNISENTDCLTGNYEENILFHHKIS